jgi:CubicO group peptidase (beta-lactamase class C family)
MAEIHGVCDDRFGDVRAVFAASLDKDDVGASVAVHVDGEPVVDLWGGYADADRTVPWERDTITNVWSITKTMTALCALVLADRGEIDLDAPVARYWPEFAAAGKDGVLVRHVLSHTAGLPAWDVPLTLEDLYDAQAVAALLAAQEPTGTPGVDASYHALTQGFLIGEVVRRVTGRSLGTFFEEEVAGPLGADFHIGLPAEHDHRVAPVIPPDQVGAAAVFSGQSNPPVRADDANSPAWRRAEIPSAGGHGNARSVAAVQSVLAGGTGLLSDKTCARAAEEQFSGVDGHLGVPVRWGLGYSLNGRTLSWGGWGGSMVLVDPDQRLTVSYVMNRMLEQDALGDDRALGMAMAAYNGLAA